MPFLATIPALDSLRTNVALTARTRSTNSSTAAMCQARSLRLGCGIRQAQGELERASRQLWPTIHDWSLGCGDSAVSAARCPRAARSPITCSQLSSTSNRSRIEILGDRVGYRPAAFLPRLVQRDGLRSCGWRSMEANSTADSVGVIHPDCRVPPQGRRRFLYLPPRRASSTKSDSLRMDVGRFRADGR